MVILLAILVFVAAMIDASSRNLTEADESTDEASNVRKAMSTLTRNLSQSVLNNYWDYDDPEQPTLFQRQSELHFVSGQAQRILGRDRRVSGHAVFFQAPFGYGGAEAGNEGGGALYNELNDSLNSWGYFIEFGSDLDRDRPLRPEFLRTETALHPARVRFRLMEFRLASEKMAVYSKAFPGGTTLDEQTDEESTRAWFRDGKRLAANSRPIAENIVALVLRPRAPQELERDNDIAPNYFYDSRLHQYDPPTDSKSLSAISRHQLPPVVDVTMIAVSEDSYMRAESVDPNVGEAIYRESAKFFWDATATDQDIRQFEEFLQLRNISFRTLTVSIAIPAAKWVTSTDS